ncbi:hypothetical protein [Kineococcus sp. NPDC059986]|uniref:hypothetical protein n=1 Tax=Actinomycetes TaxID=1760 RepID=UPI00344D786E
MAIRTRKDEREQVAALLEQDWESADKLSDALLKLSYELLQNREWWVFGARVDGTLVLPYGFFSTDKEAVKAAQQIGGPIAGVVKIYPTAKLREKILALSKPIEPSCPDCGHKFEIHMATGARPGCIEKRCNCERRHAA